MFPQKNWLRDWRNHVFQMFPKKIGCVFGVITYFRLFGTHFGNTFITLFWDPFWGLSVLYLISLKSLTSFENIAHDGTFSTVPGCTWLCLGLPCSNLPQTATDWLKLFCIYRLKCSKAISGTERDKWDGNLCYKHCSASITYKHCSGQVPKREESKS